MTVSDEHYTRINDINFAWQVGDTLFLKCACGEEFSAPAYTTGTAQGEGIASKFAEHVDEMAQREVSDGGR